MGGAEPADAPETVRRPADAVGGETPPSPALAEARADDAAIGGFDDITCIEELLDVLGAGSPSDPSSGTRGPDDSSPDSDGSIAQGH